MADYRSTFTLAADPADVIAYVADLTKLAEWDASVRSANLASDTGPAVGRRFDVTVGFYGRELDATYEIVEYDCGSTVAWTIDGKAAGATRIHASPTDTGCSVDYHLTVSMKGIARLLDRGLSVALEGIGDNIEHGLRRQFNR